MRHERNRGIAAAIATRTGRAPSEIVASIDADCTYEPVQLVSAVPLLADDVDMVVASPYHPAGKVVGVAAWRLLCRAASRLYRSSCETNCTPTRAASASIARARWSICRYPRRFCGRCGAALAARSGRRTNRRMSRRRELRTTGQSKMRVARTAFAHLGLLAQAACRSASAVLRAAALRKLPPSG